MLVRTQSDGRTVTGLYIGARNVRRHFPKKSKTVELQFDHLCIDCALIPGFWRAQPEICDQRLCDWLTLRLFHGRSCSTPIPLAMIPAGNNAFRLQPFRTLTPRSSGLSKIGLGAAPVQKLDSKTDCRATVCRVRQFISCSVNDGLQDPPR